MFKILSSEGPHCIGEPDSRMIQRPLSQCILYDLAFTKLSHPWVSEVRMTLWLEPCCLRGPEPSYRVLGSLYSLWSFICDPILHVLLFI
jgi:hypothetical protein